MRHCIIGAGFSGLPVGKKLKELGEEFDILDKNTGVGGLWHTGVYRDAQSFLHGAPPNSPIILCRRTGRIFPIRRRCNLIWNPMPPIVDSSPISS